MCVVRPRRQSGHVDHRGHTGKTQDDGEFSIGGIKFCSGEGAVDKNPKEKKPAKKKGSALSQGGKAAASEVRAPKVRVSNEETARILRETTAGNDKIKSDAPRLIHRDGVAYLEGCDAPVWRLEMARRAGSDTAALTAAFPGLTSVGLDLAFAYARRHRAKLDRLIRRQGPAAMLASDEGADDAVTFEADLDTLLNKNAEVFRRLAQ
jgi:hypothetical protein